MTVTLKTNIIWLVAGPVSALLFSFASWFMINHLTPGKLEPVTTLIKAYPLGLAMSLLTPWGWLMYGGVIFMNTNKFKLGLYCTLGGALILGVFWPIWSTHLAAR
ncbi:MAG: hypothetical protein OEZ38_02625 [Gammaproteobacteria bacterium]|nr:hypothetical protein [Gammaproteobacteria bacterium]